jgi:hypothetical protein
VGSFTIVSSSHLARDVTGERYPSFDHANERFPNAVMSVLTGRKIQYAGKSDESSTPTLAALEEQHDESIASFESDGSSPCSV